MPTKPPSKTLQTSKKPNKHIPIAEESSTTATARCNPHNSTACQPPVGHPKRGGPRVSLVRRWWGVQSAGRCVTRETGDARRRWSERRGDKMIGKVDGTLTIDDPAEEQGACAVGVNFSKDKARATSRREGRKQARTPAGVEEESGGGVGRRGGRWAVAKGSVAMRQASRVIAPRGCLLPTRFPTRESAPDRQTPRGRAGCLANGVATTTTAQPPRSASAALARPNGSLIPRRLAGPVQWQER